jgi:SAM-dependent methyltransferase
MDSSPYSVLARVYDLQHNVYTPDIAMYERWAHELAPGQPVLEIGCGTGRVLLPLARAGIRITGIDNAPAMLTIAQDRAGNLPNVKLVLADALTIDLGTQFGLVFIALNTFLHNQTRAAQVQTLRNAHRHLHSSGALIIDLPPNDELANQPDDGEWQFEATIIDPVAKTRIDKFVASSVHWATQTQTLKYRMIEAGQATEVSFDLRHVFKHEMELLLLITGFSEPTWYGDYDLTPYQADSPRMICVARPA